VKVTVCDQKFAVSSNNLALSLQGAASAASASRVTIDELIGDSTAIMQVTRESGSVVGKQKLPPNMGTCIG